MDRGAWNRLQSMGPQRVGHNWATNTFTFTSTQAPLSFLTLAREWGTVSVSFWCNIFKKTLLEWLGAGLEGGRSYTEGCCITLTHRDNQSFQISFNLLDYIKKVMVGVFNISLSLLIFLFHEDKSSRIRALGGQKEPFRAWNHCFYFLKCILFSYLPFVGCV